MSERLAAQIISLGALIFSQVWLIVAVLASEDTVKFIVAVCISLACSLAGALTAKAADKEEEEEEQA